MKKTAIWILTAALGAALWASPAQAGNVALYGSYWDTEDTGENIGGGARLGLMSVGSLEFEARVSFYEEATDDLFDRILDGEDPRTGNGIQVTPVELGVRFNLGRPIGFRPYIGAGASYYVLDADTGDVDDEGGYYGLFGFELGDQSGLRFFAEAMYRTVEATVEFDRDDFPDITIDEDQFDIDLGGVAINAGVTWSW
ncbi:MAG: outer membrane beta-barrel protein [Acidobacteriota bacterium]